MDGERTIDDVLATVFRAPHSYTGEDSVEISCHGSAYIVSEILRLAQAAGARMAEPGEFTIRAYLAGKLDLSQAEAVADLIASSSRAAHALATGQMRGGYSAALEGLRQKLLDLASLLELELDFSEEDVEFADREELRRTMESIRRETDTLRNSFSLGNALKEGVAVAIAGAPNAGKSTLLNRLLRDDRALVSDIAGTTRDVIEEQANIDGVLFRFLDTAGIRTTDDQLERMGIERTLASIARARIVIHLIDATTIKETIPAPDFRSAKTRPSSPSSTKPTPLRRSFCPTTLSAFPPSAAPGSTCCAARSAAPSTPRGFSTAIPSFPTAAISKLSARLQPLSTAPSSGSNPLSLPTSSPRKSDPSSAPSRPSPASAPSSPTTSSTTSSPSSASESNPRK